MAEHSTDMAEHSTDMAEHPMDMATVMSRYAVCIHQCHRGGCRNSAGSKIWSRYGNPLRKHAASKVMHPRCDAECPGYVVLGRKLGIYSYQTILTVDQVDTMVDDDDGDEEMSSDGSDGSDDNENDVDDMDVDDGDISTTFSADTVARLSSASIPVSREPSQGSDNQAAIDINTEVSQFDAPKAQHALDDSITPYRLIYVPDPTRYGTRESAPSDLAFMKTTIPAIEWKNIKHLDRSVFLVRHNKSSGEVTVYMQEWVRDHYIAFARINKFAIVMSCGSPLAEYLQKNAHKTVLRGICQLERFPRRLNRRKL
jgi:hypothetical protein